MTLEIVCLRFLLSRDLVHQGLAELQNSISHLETCFDVLRGLRVKVDPIYVAQTLCGAPRIDVFFDELSDLLEGIGCLDSLGHEEVKEVRVTDIFWPLVCEDFGVGFLIEVIELDLE